MHKYIVNGNKKLYGSLNISGAKNSALAILASLVLGKGICNISNIPNIDDVNIQIEILKKLGLNINNNNNIINVEGNVNIDNINDEILYSLMKKIRASYYFLGALLARYKYSKIVIPGGCNFGNDRPIDQHINNLKKLGATFHFKNDFIIAETSKQGLHGADIILKMASVGATINIILASVLIYNEKTTIYNAAKEPHVVDLIIFLNNMGAKIIGAGTNIIIIYGVKELIRINYKIIPDQIEAGTYMIASMITNGNLKLNNISLKYIDCIKKPLISIGARITSNNNCINISNYSNILNNYNITTGPYPEFPTDMQPQIVALLSIANGTSIIKEQVWNNRYKYVKELIKMGANISINSNIAIINGPKELKGSIVKAHDLRAGAAMIIAALGANGITEIYNINNIERGYEDLVGKLISVGADIKKVAI